MEIKEIKDLINFLSTSGLEEVNIETEQFKIRTKRGNGTQVFEKSSKDSLTIDSTTTATTPIVSATTPVQEVPIIVENNYIEIKSPMIGTFYRSANPESNVFVSVGDSVFVGKTVCIIEAMKLFNEIESEISGKIVKVLVDNGQPVEYDQPLFLVDPS